MRFDLFKKNQKEENTNGMPYKYTDTEEEPHVGFKDRFAMWLSGVLIIGIPCFLMILLVLGVTFLLFGGR